ncbi:hypothetical protein HMPREF0658_1469 [Hoylesella marshii DSM 16973 = JCM 13450]|uniref:Uncharacterized protein n=1 Tax=Hoylesella marshii DSM 16973 = JCM 13450 TaxID=862515 RepID=E0NTG7_9BACT|nr:hypothetical protein HMPREF0658_1469 [Hoylesella marshii DSM 16973 = JCM 13450]
MPFYGCKDTTFTANTVYLSQKISSTFLQKGQSCFLFATCR